MSFSSHGQDHGLSADVSVRKSGTFRKKGPAYGGTTWEKFESEIERIAREIAEKYQPERIVLFGSCARGEVDEDSDVDMLVIKQTDKPSFERGYDVSRLIRNRMVPFEVIVYTPAELEHRLKLRDPFIREILEEGKILYEKQ